MNSLQADAVPRPSAEETEAFDAAFACVHGARMAYVVLNARTRSHPDYVDPEGFIDGVCTAAFADRALWTPERVDRFWRHVEGRDPPAKFALVAASLHALRRGERARAGASAKRALALLQNDLFLQSIHRRATRPEADDEGLKERFCRVPFENLETAPNGDAYFCCPAWLPVPIGNIEDGDVWNAPAAQDIRASIHDGSYRHCSRVHCPKLSGGTLEAKADIKDRALAAVVAAKATRLERKPKNVILSHDRSCNLACPSCRTGLVLAGKAEQDRLNRLADETIFPLLSDAKRLRLTGSGDPFGSAHFQYVLKNLHKAGNDAIRLVLQTNGLLLTERLWNGLRLEGRVDAVIVSADAADAATYAVVRRGGDFARLLRNLDFVASLRREGRIGSFRLDFVVQALNYREMPAFVRLARRLGCDGVKFQMLRSWGTFAADEYAGHDVGAPAHPAHGDFLAVLRDPALDWEGVEVWGLDRSLRTA
ncbi:MAG: radical SAM protein [Geminicoccaceae bacterium]|nr:radical SAM protein [Geminicoccaceae bacterium]